jgi:hypothetical protein
VVKVALRKKGALRMWDKRQKLPLPQRYEKQHPQGTTRREGRGNSKEFDDVESGNGKRALGRELRLWGEQRSLGMRRGWGVTLAWCQGIAM